MADSADGSVRNCPLCDAADARTVLRDAQVVIVRCRRCGMMYQNPLPAQLHESEERKDAAYYANYLASRAARKRLFAEKFDRYLAPLGPGKALDVGCGLGEFLEVARERGWDAVGVDSCRWACEYLAQLGLTNVRECFVEEAGYSDGEFDAVHMSHVLEHVPHPRAFLGEIRRILKPGGLALIEVPRETHLPLRNAAMNLLRGRNAEPIRPEPLHLSLFNRRTLGRMLAASGFQPLVLKTEGHASKNRRDAFVFSRTPAVRLALLLCRLNLDVLLGFGHYVYAVARSAQPR